MAYISEINYAGNAGAAGGEFVEIVLAPGEIAANYVVSVYRHDGTLHTGAGIAGGEVRLSNVAGTA